jgi:hypothetical protein
MSLTIETFDKPRPLFGIYIEERRMAVLRHLHRSDQRVAAEMRARSEGVGRWLEKHIERLEEDSSPLPRKRQLVLFRRAVLDLPPLRSYS